MALGSFTVCWLSTWGQETSAVTCGPAGAPLNYKMALQCPFEPPGCGSSCLSIKQSVIFDVLWTEGNLQLKGRITLRAKKLKLYPQEKAEDRQNKDTLLTAMEKPGCLWALSEQWGPIQKWLTLLEACALGSLLFQGSCLEGQTQWEAQGHRQFTLSYKTSFCRKGLGSEFIPGGLTHARCRDTLASSEPSPSQIPCADANSKAPVGKVCLGRNIMSHNHFQTIGVFLIYIMLQRKSSPKNILF